MQSATSGEPVVIPHETVRLWVSRGRAPMLYPAMSSLPAFMRNW